MQLAKLVFCVAGCAVAPMASAAAQGNQGQAAALKDLPQSPLEAFATRTTATVVWSKTTGRLDSSGAYATFTAVIVEDRTTATRMRGLRIDLAHIGTLPGCDWKYEAWRILCQRANAAVYVEEARLEEARNAIARGAAELRPFEFISQYWAQDVSGAISGGLIVCGYEFPRRQPHELAELFMHAIAELRAASR